MTSIKIKIGRIHKGLFTSIVFALIILTTGCSGTLFEGLTTESDEVLIQDLVFSTSLIVQGGETVTIVSSGDSTNEIWFAPAGTVLFVEGTTMTKALSGTATAIFAPVIEGDYKVFVIDIGGIVHGPSIATLTVDNTPVTVTINQSGSQADPTNSVGAGFEFTVVFNHFIDTSTFTIDDITQNGTATVDTWTITNSGDDINYTLQATVITDDGTVVPSINADTLQSPAGNNNNVSTATDNSVTYDTVPPTATTSGEPTGTSATTVLDITIAGADVQYYQYKIGVSGSTDCSSATGYSSDIAVVTHITNDISALADGEIKLCVTGKDSADNYQIYGSATEKTWTKDTTGAVATITNAPGGINNTTLLDVTVGGTGIIEYQYKVGNGISCTGGGYTGGGETNGGIAIATKITSDISGEVDGTIKLCVIGVKTNGIWQAEADATIATWTKDTDPPTIISAETLDANANGKIDHYKITFSSAVDDSTFPGYAENSLGTTATGWVVLNFPDNRKLRHGTAVTFATDIVDDNIIYLSFDENSDTCTVSNPPVSTDQDGCDTGSKPDLTMTSTALQDIYENTVAVVATGDLAESDGSPPIVVGAYPYSNITLHTYYSESVTSVSSECSDSTACSSIYSINPSLTINGAIRQADNHVVVLSMSAQTYTTSYTLTSIADIVKDVNNLGVISSANTASFTGAQESTNLILAEAIDNTTVELTFNVSVTSATAQGTPTVYTISGLTVTAANMYPTPGSNSTKVRLTTSSHLSDTTDGYTVTITSGIVTAVTGGQICNSPNNTAVFTGDKLPAILSVSSVSFTEVDVTFSEDVLWDGTGTGALNSTNYCIETHATATSDCTGTTLNVSGAASQVAPTKVRLTTAVQTSNTLYTVTVSNIVDSTTPAGNTISSTANTGNFVGGEKIKITRIRRVLDSSSSFNVFRVVFSQPFMYNNGTDTNDADNLSNWDFGDLNTGGYVTTLCTAADDAACPISYTQGTDTVIYFKVTPEPGLGAHTVVGATAAGSPTGAAGCILPDGGSSPGDCLQSNPNDRGTVDFGLPIVIEDGSVYTDPFNDASTMSGQVILYNGKLLIGPNSTDSGLFQTEINLSNSVSITLDSDNVNSGFQPFDSSLYENCDTGTWPNCTAGTLLEGIDYMYAGCYKSDGSAETTLTGNACSSAGGTEYLFVLGYNKNHVGGGSDDAYQSNWSTTNTVSPFVFNRIGQLSNCSGLTYRAMSIVIFKGKIYQAQQHERGSWAPRWSMFEPDGTMYGVYSPTYGSYDMGGRYLNRIGEGASIPNGQGNATNGLISIDVMYEYDNDGTGSNTSQLYIANGGSCDGDCLSNATPYRDGTTDADGGVLRTRLAYSTDTSYPLYCTSSGTGVNGCGEYWEDVTPTAGEWLKYMSIALPDDARPNGDWDQLLPENTIIPAIKAVPKMVEFNGDLYMIRNACSSNTVHTQDNGNFLQACSVTASVCSTETVEGDCNAVSGCHWDASCKSSCPQTCPVGSEIPQLWRLPEGTTGSPNGAGDWVLVAEYGTTGRTDMNGASWADGSDQSTKTGLNLHITLLVVNGDRLYIGYDNQAYGLNVWRTKSGITTPASENDFEAVCQTGSSCSDSSKQFGWGSSSDTKIFDGISVNDAGTDYVIFSTRSGVDPMRIYRTSNE